MPGSREQWAEHSPRYRSFDQFRPGRWWQVLRWLTLALFVLTLVVGPLVGERASTFAALEGPVRTGSVTDVQVEGQDLDPDGADEFSSGMTTYRLVWREGWQRRFAEVERVAGTGGTTDSSATVITQPVTELLRAWNPDVQLRYAEPRTAWSTIGEYRAPAGWAFLPLVTGVLWLAVLANGPEPRLATRWAWFWLAFSPAVVLLAPAYLILGGQGATPGARRITGGWAFLISILFLGGLGFAS